MGDAERHRGILLDEEDGGALAVDVADRLEDLLDQDGRQPHARLVEQQQARAGHQRPADGEHLLLAARERARDLGQAFLEAREEGEDPLEVGLDPVIAPAVGAHHEVLLDAQTLEDAPALGDMGDPAKHDLVGGHAGQRLVVERDRALPRRHQPGNGLERGRLAGSIVAEDGDDFAAAHLDPDALEGVDLVVEDVETLNLQHGPSACGPTVRARDRLR